MTKQKTEPKTHQVVCFRLTVEEYAKLKQRKPMVSVLKAAIAELPEVA